jgi:glutamate racemase
MIGIFDSGAGGLSVYREIRKILPEQDCIYYSDNANCPYGSKPKEFIIRRAKDITEFLLSEGAEIIVVACNTATAVAIKSLREDYPSVRFIGMEPAIKPAAQSTCTGVIGVLATAGTLCSEKYLTHKEKYAGDIRIAEHVGEGFVELVESGTIAGAAAEEVVSRSLKPLLDAGADTIVLGCTHYPFLSDTISKVASELYPERSVMIIDPAPAVAKHLKDVMQEEGLLPCSAMAHPRRNADHASSHNLASGTTILHSSGDSKTLKDFFSNL